MRFASTFAAFTALSLVSAVVSSAINIPDASLSLESANALITTAPVSPHLEARAGNGRKPYKRRPYLKYKPKPQHPKGCSNTELIRNGDFDKNTRGWFTFLGSGLAQAFWIKSSRQRPAHSGDGQLYIFMNRGPAFLDYNTKIKAVEYGNAITISMWMRYEEPADVSSCRVFWGVRGVDGGLEFTLTPDWKKYSFEIPGSGRDQELQMRMNCDNLPTPAIIYLDDVSVKACVPKNPNPECQVVKGSDNLLVNPGFECPDGITVWMTQSNSYGTDALVQYSSSRGNPTHSGKGMGGFVYDSTQQFTGLAIFQYDIPGDLSRQFMKASFWLSADAKTPDLTGCQLSVSTRTGYYLYGVDLSGLTSNWKKFEIKDIVPDALDDFMIDISWCSAPTYPIIYIDDVYFGVDKSSPPATKPTTTVTEPPTTPTPAVCTTTPFVIDPSFETDETLNNWMTSNPDIVIYSDFSSTYGPPHDGNAAAVFQLTPNANVGITQYTSGLCPNTAYTASVWFYVPAGYDPTVCQYRLGITGASELFQVTQTGVWQKLEFAFYVEASDANNPFLVINIGVFCENTNDQILLVDDFRYGPAPPCNTVSTIANGGFESGTLPDWGFGGYEGDETIAVTSAKAHTGSRSGLITFPTTSNGLGFTNEFPTCVGQKYTWRLWYFIPRAHKGVSCQMTAGVFFTGEYFTETVSTYDTWVEFKLDFTSGGADMTLSWSLFCRNRLEKMVVYIDDVSVERRI